MFLNFRSAFFFGLVASSFAAPFTHVESPRPGITDLSSLERRVAGVIPSSVTCGNDRFGRPVVIPRQRILNALNAADTPAQSSRQKWYPSHYMNKNGVANVLTDASALV